MITERKIADRLHWGVALTPIITVLIFYSVILHARLASGDWPSRHGVEPDEISIHSIPFGFHCILAFVSIVATSLSPIAWIALLCQAHRLQSLQAYIIRLVIFILCLSLALWIGYNDPGRFLNWFVD